MPDVKMGFARLTPEERRAMASVGGKAAHAQGKAHRFTREEAAEAGKLGGEAISRDRDHMSEIGKKGGAVTSADRDHMADIGRRGGEAVRDQRGKRHFQEIGRVGAAKAHGAPCRRSGPVHAPGRINRNRRA